MKAEFPTFQTMGNDPIDSVSGRVERINSQPRPLCRGATIAISAEGLPPSTVWIACSSPARRQQEAPGRQLWTKVLE